MRYAVALTVPVVLLATVPALQFRHWPWIALALAAPVVLGAGAPVHRAAAGELRHGRPGVGVLASAGPLAALAASLHALLFGAGGVPGFQQQTLGLERPVLLDVAAVLTVLVLPAARTAARSADPDDQADPGSPARRVGRRLAPLVLGTAVAVLGVRLGAGDGAGGLAGAASVLVAGCPAALLLAAPLVVRAARAPLLTGAQRVDTVVLTADATLRTGELEVARVHTLPGVDGTELRRLAAALHAGHRGPLARAVAAGAAPELAVSDADGTPGTGLRGMVAELRATPDGPRVVAHAVLAGPPDWLAAHGVDVGELGDLPGLLVARDGELRGALELGDVLAPGADEALTALHRRGVTVVRPHPGAAGTACALRERGRVVALVGEDGPGGVAPRLAAVAAAVVRSHRAVTALRAGVAIGLAAALGGAALAAAGRPVAVVVPLVAALAVALLALLVVASAGTGASARHERGYRLVR